MAAASKQVLLGDLPSDFLRISASSQQQIANDHQTALMLQAQQADLSAAYGAPAQMARISITVAQAKLTKNYGLTKMDPYCRLRVGNFVLETPTEHSGGRNPRWNKTVQCFIPDGVDAIYLEIFDERAFTTDERIAWAHIQISERVFQGQPVDEWYPLNGKQGDGKEGMINLILAYVEASAVIPVAVNMYPAAQTVVTMPPGVPPYYPAAAAVGGPVAPPPPTFMQQPVSPAYTEEDVQQVKDMFPAIDDDVVRSVFESNMGNKDQTINDLLSLSSS